MMKESLIGFERLYDRFGPFDVSTRMVFINKKGKYRVWINEDVAKNNPSKRSLVNQK